MLSAQRERIVEFAAAKHLPAFYSWREFVDSEGLMSYGPNVVEMHRRMASCVDKIFSGSKPADLPLERPVKFKLIINLKTVKALGLSVSPAVLAVADEVIE